MTTPRAAKVCPREPTQEMLRHARLLPSFGVVDIWRAMYDAAPSAAPSDDALDEAMGPGPALRTAIDAALAEQEGKP